MSLNFDPPLTNGTQDLTLEAVLDLSHDLIDIKKNTVSTHSSATVEVTIFSRKSADGTTVEVDATTHRPLQHHAARPPSGRGVDPDGASWR